MDTLKKIRNVCIWITAPCWIIVLVVGVFFPKYVNSPVNQVLFIVGLVTCLIAAGTSLFICLCWFAGAAMIFWAEVCCLYLYVRLFFSRFEFQRQELERKIKKEEEQIEDMSFTLDAL